MTRRGAWRLVPVALLGLAAAPVPWEEMIESDWIYALATRFATIEGHRVHYPTPTAEMARLLESSAERDAKRHLADARRALGDLAGAEAALQAWAASASDDLSRAEAWSEVARWAAAHLRMPLAFRAAERALPGLTADDKRVLADERIRWAEAHPEAGDALSLRRDRALLIPGDAGVQEDYVRALEKAERLDEADKALAAGEKTLGPARSLLLRSQLLARHKEHRRAFEVLEKALLATGDVEWDEPLRRAWAERTDAGAAGAPESWRSALEQRFDGPALKRLAVYFQGQGRGGHAADLLRQVERRYESVLDRDGRLLVARLYADIDAVPEAFRARLAAAQQATEEQRRDDLAPLARLALKAGGRPLAWGVYNDEPYRWAARVDGTPGFWTGGVSFLLTGQDWKEALSRLESESLPERTFATAKALVDELVRLAPAHAAIPSLRVALMSRHVERGEGKDALALLPRVEGAADPAAADEARKVALLAARLVEVPLGEELRLFRAQLKSAAPDGSRPRLRPDPSGSWIGYERPYAMPSPPRYKQVLDEAVSRLDQRDRTHRASLELLLLEMDRLPDAEDVWADLASRLESWNLDDELGPRYDRALARFQDAGWWARAARWYARRSRRQDLVRLAGEITARFRGAQVFARTDPGVTLEVPEQPPQGGRVRLVRWADWVRLAALERFPHSPTVVKEALGRLVTRTDWEKERVRRGETALAKERPTRVVVDDALAAERRWAVLFAEASIREGYVGGLAREGKLEPWLIELEKRAEKTPVEDQLLFEGWSRLSQFERAAAAADRFAAAYPGDGDLAGRVLTLHRSLGGLDPAHAAPAEALVARTAPAVLDPVPLWTELGELHEERGRPERALPVWRQIVDRDPRNPERISELATLLWDYGHMAEALAVVEDGRARLARPRFFAFEAGVLREEVRDVEGAVREYLAALWPESSDCCAFFERDQRSLRRLAQLLGRERVRALVLARIDRLQPGVTTDEEALASLFPIAPMTTPEPGLDGDADDWIDGMDMPHDPVGRAQREAAMAAARPRQHAGIDKLTSALLDKTLAMVPKATGTAFLDSAEPWSRPLIDARWDRARAVAFRNAVMARRSELAPAEEDRIAREVERARFLAENGRLADADALWAGLVKRIDALPEGGRRMHAEAERAGYVERTRGPEAAATTWRDLTRRYPWSLGLLEDRLTFLNRTGRGAEAREALAAVVPRAAAGHRENLLARLTRESIDAGDLPRARRAVEQLLDRGLPDAERLSAVHLLARLSLKENASFDPLPLAKAETAKLPGERHPDLYEQLARAADLEKAHGTAVTLWIEALNRRLERAWLEEACRSADRAGRGKELLAFFEKQQERSPRDVRWAVAVREIRRHGDDIAGAIAMAKAAVAVRPEQESLWREAADLMVRADRVREAADFLAEWTRPRAADEDAARWRGELYARAGDGERAFIVENEALAAFARATPEGEDRGKELKERRARAARRLGAYGHPRLAWKLLEGDAVVKVAGSALTEREQADLALLTGNFLRLLRQRLGDAGYVTAAAQALEESGRGEQKEEVQAFVLRRLFPTAGARGSDAALAQLWPFVEGAGLEPQLRLALARRTAGAVPGPWQAGASVAFLESVGRALVVRESPANNVVFRQAPLEALWVRDLARRDRGTELHAFLEPRWRDLMVRVRSAAPIPPESDRVEWAAWLDDPRVLEAWARGAATSSETRADLFEVMPNRRLWDRLWALASRGWNVSPMVALLPPAPRTAWLRFWQAPPAAEDPVLRARRESGERVALAVGRLVAGSPDAAADPLVRKLRGPRTVGEVLGSDAAWTWPEFTPRRGPTGDVLEQGDDRIVGQGADAGRLPGAFWGARPGEAWYVLETLASWRERTSTAPLLTLEVPERARQGERASLATQLAQSLGDLPLALELQEAFPGRAHDPAALERGLRLLVGAAQGEKANARLGEEVRHAQGSMSEAQLRSTTALAQELSLTAPLDLMDPAQPIAPGLLAYLHDRRAPAAVRFTTRDEVGFRMALASRWAGRDRVLSADQVRFALKQLWPQGAGDLPRRGLARLGGLWPHAADWLAARRPADRAAAVAALEALPDPAPFEALAGEAKDDVTLLLRVRIHLLRSEEPQALALVDEMRQGLEAAPGLQLQAEEAAAEAEGDEAGEETVEAEEEEAPAAAVTEEDPLVPRLSAWLRPFRDARRAAPVEERFRGLLRERRAAGRVSVAAWRLALELTTEAEGRAALLKELEHAWIRGDWQPEELGPVVEALARFAPEETKHWLARWPQVYDHAEVTRRARVFTVLKDHGAAARLLSEARPRVLWSGSDELRAFDAWRAALAHGGTLPSAGPAPPVSPASPAGPAPPSWTAAVAFWTRTPEEATSALAAHLRRHPYDLLSARSALRSVAPGEEDALYLASITLDDPAMRAAGNAHLDGEVMRLRRARGLLPTSAHAAAATLEGADPRQLARELTRRRFRRADVDAALADIARIAAGTDAGATADTALGVLTDRRSPLVASLRAELRRLGQPQGPPQPFRIVNGAPAPYRPRDLTWAVLRTALAAAEASR